jgi:hypothetical protein
MAAEAWAHARALLGRLDRPALGLDADDLDRLVMAAGRVGQRLRHHLAHTRAR